MKKDKLNKVFDTYQKKVKSQGMSVRIENEDGTDVWERSFGTLEGDKRYMIASVTKMFATAILLQIMEEGKLFMEDQIIKYLPKEYCTGLHIFKGVDYTDKLTILHLMTQTSGLPCYFSEEIPGEGSGEKMLKSDRELTLDERVQRTKKLKAKFIPGSKKSYYSDINWDLLLPVIENVTGMSIHECYQKYIFDKVELPNTYLYTSKEPLDFPEIWIKDRLYSFPKLLDAWPLSGAIISTNRDMNAFLKAFYGGKLFLKPFFERYNTYCYNQMFPMEYGLGNIRFRYPGVPLLWGHSGATGVVCYYAPQKNMYISACINELNEVKVTQMLGQLAHNL